MAKVVKKAQVSGRERADEIMKCAEDAKYFINKYVRIAHPTKGTIPFKTFKYQDECIDAFQENRKVIVNKSRQLGLSTITAAYSLWMAIFFRNREIVSIATKLETAKLFLKKVKGMYESLPEWLVITEIESFTKTEISFKNGSRIQAVPTSDSAARGASLSLLVIDECVTGETKITIRNKNTNEIRLVPIEDVYSKPEYHKDIKIMKIEVISE